MSALSRYVFDIFELVVVIGLFQRSAARHDDNLIDLFEIEQPIGDIDHDVAHADNRDPPADLEIPLAKRRQRIIVIDDVLRVVHAERIFAFDA